jgi:hypothetical protein
MEDNQQLVERMNSRVQNEMKNDVSEIYGSSSQLTQDCRNGVCHSSTRVTVHAPATIISNSLFKSCKIQSVNPIVVIHVVLVFLPLGPLSRCLCLQVLIDLLSQV